MMWALVIASIAGNGVLVGSDGYGYSSEKECRAAFTALWNINPSWQDGSHLPKAVYCESIQDHQVKDRIDLLP